MEDLRQHFSRTLDKTGIALTGRQLLAYAKDRGLRGVGPREISAIVSEHPSTAKFAAVKRPKNFQTIGVVRSGVYFIDHAVFRPEWSWHNKGNTGFLVAVENLTNRLYVSPCKGKASGSWLEAVQSFVELNRTVRTIFSDRDAVATAPTFRRTIMSRYNLRWYFLTKGSKSYLAERYIRFVKTQLSIALQHKNTKNWIQFVPALLQTYNAQKIGGTDYTRQGVHRDNFETFLRDYFKSSQPELAFNAAKAGPFAQDTWNRKIFRFKLGQRVLLSRAANWRTGREAGGAFLKASTRGGFGDKTYTVSGRQLRAARGLKDFVTVYSLSEMGPSVHFYQSELKSVDSRQ